MAARPDPLTGAKKALSTARRFTQSVEGTDKSQFAPKVTPSRQTTPIVRAAKTPQVPTTWGGATSDIIAHGGKLPQMHKGGVVPGKPGEEKVVKLEAGEKVTPAKDKKMADEKKDSKKKEGAKSKPLSVKDVLAKDKESKSSKSEPKKKAKYKHTHIEHHADGSHTIRHTPGDGGEEMSYSRPDHAGMMQGLEENLGGGGAPAGGAEEEAAEGEAPAAGAGGPVA